MNYRRLLFLVIMVLLSSCSSQKYPAEPSLPADSNFNGLEGGLNYFNPDGVADLLSGAVVS